MNIINSNIFFLSHFSLWIVDIAICEDPIYTAARLGHYYAGKTELRLHHNKESPWRGKIENSSIFKYATIRTPDYNTYMNKTGINYADKSQYGAARPGKGYIPVLGGYAGGVKTPPAKYGSTYDQDAEDGLYKQPGQAYMYYPSPTPSTATTATSTSTTASSTSTTTDGGTTTTASERRG